MGPVTPATVSLRDRIGRAADHADRWARDSELHPQLAGARKSRTVAGPVRALRRRGDRVRRRRAGAVDCGSRDDGGRDDAARRRRAARRAAGALGRRAHLARPARARSARRLRVRAPRLRPRRTGGVRPRAPERRPACLDGGRGRHDDAFHYDARVARPYRPRARGVLGHPGDLRSRVRRRNCSGDGGIHARMDQPARACRGLRLDCGVRRLCRGLRADARAPRANQELGVA